MRGDTDKRDQRTQTLALRVVSTVAGALASPERLAWLCGSVADVAGGHRPRVDVPGHADARDKARTREYMTMMTRAPRAASARRRGWSTHRQASDRLMFAQMRSEQE
jgi:hypothetical protein